MTMINSGFKRLNSKICKAILTNIFHPLEVVGRDSEIELQVGENFK